MIKNNNENNTLNLFFVLDKNYIVPFTVALTSILENNKDLEIHVFIIHEMEQNETLNIAHNFFKDKYNLSLNLLPFEDKYFNNFFISDHITKATYFKILLGQIIPKSVTQGLYLDGDIVVLGSLKEFCNRSFFNHAKGVDTSLLAVTDVRAGVEIQRLNKLGVKITNYFNAGIFYVNLKTWREEKVAEKMIEIGSQYNEKLSYHDQDVMNIFFNNNYVNLEDTYNKDAAVKHDNLPVILHYHGNSKPWHYVNNGPNKHFYYKYLKLTPFKNLKPEGITLVNFARKYVRLFRQLRSKGPNYSV